MGASTTQGTGTGGSEGPLRGYDLDNIRRVYINQNGNLLPCIYIIGSGGGEKYVLRAVGDEQGRYLEYYPKSGETKGTKSITV